MQMKDISSFAPQPFYFFMTVIVNELKVELKTILQNMRFDSFKKALQHTPLFKEVMIENKILKKKILETALGFACKPFLK
jgi:hypothetical protein